ncbi:MAG: anthranilate synthase component I, partial [Phycisphaerae bacterium]
MLEFLPSREEFATLRDRVNTVPVYTSLLSDRLTPVLAFDRLAAGTQHAFLLESVIGGEKLARYSFLSANPAAHVQSTGPRTVVSDATGEHVFDGVDPITKLEESLARYRTAHPAGLPRFLGGAVGYAAYDIARHYEPKLSAPPPDDRGLPDMLFGLYDQIVVFDHVRKLVHVVVHAPCDAGVTHAAAYDHAVARIESIVATLSDARPGPLKPLVAPPVEPADAAGSLSQDRFQRGVEVCRDYIRAGDAFQIVLSQRL